jgi:hypothetical protein
MEISELPVSPNVIRFETMFLWNDKLSQLWIFLIHRFGPWLDGKMYFSFLKIVSKHFTAVKT